MDGGVVQANLRGVITCEVIRGTKVMIMWLIWYLRRGLVLSGVLRERVAAVGAEVEMGDRDRRRKGGLARRGELILGRHF